MQGTIFDSAPGDRKMIGLYRAISAIYGKKKPLNWAVALFATLSLLVIWFFEVQIRFISFIHYVNLFFFNNLGYLSSYKIFVSYKQ